MVHVSTKRALLRQALKTSYSLSTRCWDPTGPRCVEYVNHLLDRTWLSFGPGSVYNIINLCQGKEQAHYSQTSRSRPPAPGTMQYCHVKCADKNHRIGLSNDGELSLLDHDIEEEETLHEMGLETSHCFELMVQMRDNPGGILSFATDACLPELAEFALCCGADINRNLSRCIRIAARDSHSEIVELAIKYGADIHLYNDAALRDALLNGCVQTVELLLDAGAELGNIPEQYQEMISRRAPQRSLDILKRRGLELKYDEHLHSCE